MEYEKGYVRSDVAKPPFFQGFQESAPSSSPMSSAKRMVLR
jgi:hypothetical protein